MTRRETDLLGSLEVPAQAYYGIQTQRAIENFNISGVKLFQFPELIRALAQVKWASARANYKLGLLNKEVVYAIVDACREVAEGKFDREFPVDMMQGGAGTSCNMNANEVIANRALELLGFQKGEYAHCSPNDHVNLSQSTNDVYPTAIKLAIYNSNIGLMKSVESLADAFSAKAEDLRRVLKMGRTQLQDAVPMTMGQEFGAFAETIREEMAQLERAAHDFLETNMGATAIGTGLNAVPGYAQLCAQKLEKVTGHKFVSAPNLVEATPDTGSLVSYSSALKRLAVKLSKICNDLRLLSSGPRTGFFEINLPAMQPGSSIMPGKVNPVIPEVMNQICFRVIGNDTTVTFAAEAGQLQLNVMEPVMVYSILESVMLLQNGMETLRTKCVEGITANESHTRDQVLGSIGIVTALNPYIGYKKATEIARDALETGRGVYELVLERGYMTREKMDEVLDPVHMLSPKPIETSQSEVLGPESPTEK